MDLGLGLWREIRAWDRGVGLGLELADFGKGASERD